MDDEDLSSTKRHKKHKHKKHKRKRSYDSDASSEVNVVDPIVETNSKLRKSIPIIPKLPDKAIAISKPLAKKKKGKSRDSGTSSEEERWLDAIESGKLEDVDDELKKIKPKDPKLMTARQRAMYERGTDKEPVGEMLMSLPTGYKEKVMTAEAIQKAALKSQKRKQLADEKREKDKKKTMERLLKKQESKISKSVKTRLTKTAVPVITYRMNAEGTVMMFPPGIDYPLKRQIARPPPPPTYCYMQCGRKKNFSCAKTGVPLCSRDCYQKHIASCML